MPTVKELKVIAKNLNIKVKSGIRKQELVDLIEAASPDLCAAPRPLDRLTVKDLREMAKNLNIKVKKGIRKQYLIDLINYAKLDDAEKHLKHQTDCNKAVEDGCLDCLKIAHKNGCPWDEYTAELAAKGGFLEILKYLNANGCPWDEDISTTAAAHGQLECLKFSHSVDDYLCDYAPNLAVEGGHLNTLKYLIEHDCPYDWDRLCTIAKHKDIIKYLNTLTEEDGNQIMY
jgi:hypothetical protein